MVSSIQSITLVLCIALCVVMYLVWSTASANETAHGVNATAITANSAAHVTNASAHAANTTAIALNTIASTPATAFLTTDQGIYAPTADRGFEAIFVNGITEDLYIDLPTSGTPNTGNRYDISIGTVGAFNVYIRRTDAGDNISLGGTSYQNVYATTDADFVRVTSFGAAVWLVQAETPGNWTGTAL